MVAIWNPQPADRSVDQRKDYYAGYSDGFYGFAYKSAGVHQSENHYRSGFEHGQADAQRKED